jgi:hypothetical protein
MRSALVVVIAVALGPMGRAAAPADRSGIDPDMLSGGVFAARDVQPAAGAPAARNVARAGEFPDLGKGRAPVVLDARVGANVRLGDDPAALPAAQRGQAELLTVAAEHPELDALADQGAGRGERQGQ